ncbi:MAG: hypothetical protein ACPIOQ_06455 [Promethearchaeia archaeon]
MRASSAASPDPVVRVAVTSAKWSDYLKERHSEASRALGELVGAANMRTVSNASSPRYGQTSFQMRVRRRGSAWAGRADTLAAVRRGAFSDFLARAPARPPANACRRSRAAEPDTCRDGSARG